MDVVHKFHDVNYHQAEFLVIIDGERVYFNSEVIKELYNLPNNAEYPGQAIITRPIKGQAREELKVILCLSAE